MVQQDTISSLDLMHSVHSACHHHKWTPELKETWADIIKKIYSNKVVNFIYHVKNSIIEDLSFKITDTSNNDLSKMEPSYYFFLCHQLHSLGRHFGNLRKLHLCYQYKMIPVLFYLIESSQSTLLSHVQRKRLYRLIDDILCEGLVDINIPCNSRGAIYASMIEMLSANNDPGYYFDIDHSSWMELIDILLKHGADINTLDSKGRSVLIDIVHHHMLDPIRYKPIIRTISKLVKSMKEAIRVTRDKQYIVKGIMPVIEYLIENGADVNHRDNKGKTVLMYCIPKINLNVITNEIHDLLVKKGAVQ